MRRLALPAVLVVLLASTGCEQRFEEPEIEFRNLGNWEFTDRGVELEVELEVTNPNDISATVLRADYTLSINGVEAGTGHASDLRLPAGETISLNLPLSLSYGGLIDAALAGDWPEVDYVINGTAKVSALVHTREVEFSESGTEEVPLSADLLRFLH
jgi:LEA14-like dessication related protein